ncbi:MAG: OmpA family protein [Desulfobacterales bacterium]|jgi:outer membrane protein OmpA-like peptidoglycan-associated protein
MKTAFLIILSTLLALSAGFVNADELTFPKTEQEIVEALSIKDGRTVFEDVEYISEKGKVYKIIAGKRYRLRGLQSIVDSDFIPRAGALINFDFNSDQIQPLSYPLLDEFGKALKSGLADGSFIVAGHTDSVGTTEYNKDLSIRRANAVADYLMAEHGIESSRLTLKGYGEIKPIASNENEKGRSLNRRVEFIRVQ